jgi:hypothetical protein
MRRPPASPATLRYGVITTAPATASDRAGFAWATRPDLEVALSMWAGRGALLPAVGDRCVVAEADGVDPYISAWEPS